MGDLKLLEVMISSNENPLLISGIIINYIIMHESIMDISHIRMDVGINDNLKIMVTIINV